MFKAAESNIQNGKFGRIMFGPMIFVSTAVTTARGENKSHTENLELEGMNVGVYPPSLAVGDPNLNHGMVTYRACKAGFTGFSLKAGFAARFGRREGAGRDGPCRRMPCVY